MAKKIKVSQDTIDSIKKLGMTKALKLAGSNAGAAQAGLTAEYREGVRRMYGDRRLGLAEAKNKPAAAKSPDAARASVATKPAKAPVKAPAKKSSGVGGTLKKILVDTAKGSAKDIMTFGTGAAGVGVGLAGRAAAKAGLYAAKRGVVSTSGRLTAKAGKPVSQAQYDAMKASASRVSKVATAKSTAKKAAAKAATAPARARGTADSARAAATSTSGRLAAKAGKPVTETQYNAMKAAAARKKAAPAPKKRAK